MFFIAAVLVGVLWIWGVHCAFLMIFKKLADIIQHRLYQFLSWLRPCSHGSNVKIKQAILKPLIYCPPCMSSVHGALLFCLLFRFQCTIATLWIIPYIVCLAGINYLIKEALYPGE